MKISILYGTETGNAEMLAEDIQSELDAKHVVECANLCDVDPADFDGSRLYLFVCSTYGDGELPSSAQPFADAMTAAQPDLSSIQFAVFGLGDSEYDETFNHGPMKLAELMTSFGAKQLGDRVAHDASGLDMVEDVALPWAVNVVTMASEELCEAS